MQLWMLYIIIALVKFMKLGMMYIIIVWFFCKILIFHSGQYTRLITYGLKIKKYI